MTDSNKSIKIPKLTRFHQLLDKALEPVMVVLAGFDGDSLQETHVWHTIRMDPSLIDLDLTVEVPGSVSARDYKSRFDPRFHIPAIDGWGWNDYVVLAPKLENLEPWHIGWHKVRDNELFLCKLHLKPVEDYALKLLKGPNDTSFFAFTSGGSQIPLKFLDQGRHGDKKYSKLRLF